MARAVTKEGLARSRSRAMWLLPGRPDHGNPQGSTILLRELAGGIGRSPSGPVIRRFGTREITPEDLEREADRLEKMVARGDMRSRSGVVEQD
jgi:hypothetical protein